MLNCRTSVFCSFVLFSCLLVRTVCATELIQTLDLTSHTLSSTESERLHDRYFVVFLARGGSITGHAYVVWGKEDSQLMMSTQECYGLYPDKGEKKRIILGSVKARLFDGDCWNLNSTIRLIVEVDKDLYMRSFAVYEEWNKKTQSTTTEYHILWSNCITFVKEVAESIGLDTPDDQFALPQSFISGLIGRLPR